VRLRAGVVEADELDDEGPTWPCASLSANFSASTIDCDRRASGPCRGRLE